MFSVVLIGLTLTGAVQQWSTVMKREREVELLFRGDQIRKAIQRYHATAGIGKYPLQLEDLVRVPNQSATKRFLRRVYADPITGGEWGLVRVGDGIRGVYSQSRALPLKQANFPEEYQSFQGKQEYREWVFVSAPKQVQNPSTPPQNPEP